MTFTWKILRIMECDYNEIQAQQETDNSTSKKWKIPHVSENLLHYFEWYLHIYSLITITYLPIHPRLKRQSN